MTKYRKTLSASSLNSDSIYNYKDKKIGDMKDLMINLKEGKIEYAVISFGGLLGFGDKYFAVPWRLIHVDEEKKILKLNIDEKKLSNMIGIDKDNWPDELSKEERDKWEKLHQESVQEVCQV